MKNAIQFGAGNIGRGFIGAVLRKSSYNVLFCDVNREIIDKINEKKGYKLFIKDSESREEIIDNVRGIYADDNNLINEIAQSDIITTAVGVLVLPKISKSIAEGIKNKIKLNDKKYLNIIACENAINATEILKNEVLKHLNDCEKEFCEKFVGFANCSVDRIVPPCDVNSIDVFVEEFYEWNVQKDQVLGNLNIDGMNLVDNLSSYIERKLFTLNTGHTMTAYLGFLKGYETIYDSINDKFIYDNVKEAMIESGEGLIQKYSFNRESHLNYIDKIINRFKNPHLIDNVLRVGREPMRKLSKDDRFVKPILTAYNYGKKIEKLCLGAACALKFNSPKDDSSLKMQEIINEKGVLNAFREISGISEEEILNKVVKYFNEIKDIV